MRREWIALLAPVAAATLASACCIGPLILASLGLGSVGFAAGLAPYRPYLLGCTGLFLAGAFWWTYRRSAESGAACCETEPAAKKRAARARKGLLWVMTALTILVAAYPALRARSTPLDRSAVDPGNPVGAGVDQITLTIEGLTCPACEAHIESALAAVPGVQQVEARYADGRAVVVTDGSPVEAGLLVRAAERAGYQATLTAKER